MFVPNPEFDAFYNAWRRLPRRAHDLLPSRSDVGPDTFPGLLPFMALTEMLGPCYLHIFYAGSGFERNAGLPIADQNYYDLLPLEFHKPMAKFHEILLETPCGAEVSDIIVTSQGSRYLHETMQLPLVDDDGDVRFLMAYGLGRKPFEDASSRTRESHSPGNIKELHYLDIGAGAPSARIEDFIFHR
ncbi:PAS domain-containing protein [Kordiimonas marina]|uniref:PAS domain-containing protein n=1 Tax=Kordiimonas marina TaxID=2872312 RepID=UPI001FF6A77E|nr:PAS domain-containing protein [Kordiimonas marina]MCJ9427509.1 PAS domain-containing protein [Kordiimonas marina]